VIKVLLSSGFITFIFLSCCSANSTADTKYSGIKSNSCTYKVSTWNTEFNKSINIKTISHQYNKLTAEEIDTITGCTVCREDQVLIDIPPLEPFYICNKLAAEVKDTIEELIRNNAAILTVRGYKVIRSRGPIDHRGNRTEFSNHSYGTAINRELNGLYDNCTTFGPECRLLHGGRWNPEIPGTLVRGGRIVETLKSIGFKWGGEIEGKQKDFMHFSYSGY
jgi:hypothetical protein